jgi:hypothetical protein
LTSKKSSTPTKRPLGEEKLKMKSEPALDLPQTNPSESSTQKLEKSGNPNAQSLALPSSPGHGDLAWGQKVRRKLNQELKKRGVQEDELPVMLKDQVVARSRRGKAGQIVVRALSGVQKSSAAQLARRLEHDLSEGREDILEKLEASGTANQSVQKVAALLESHPQFSLARAVAEAGADVAIVLDSYAKGALALKKMETVLSIYKEMPHLMRDLLRHAIDEEVECGVCLGAGSVVSKAGARKLGQQCPRCKGTGKARTPSEHKAMAVQKVLEMSEMLPKKAPGATVNVNQAVQVNAGGHSELLARMSKAADEVLYSRTNPILDAEVIDDNA